MLAKITRHGVSALLIALMMACRAAGQQSLTPTQLAGEANGLSDLSKLGSYQLKAIVAVGSDKHGATGTLILDHEQENTRQQLEFTDYREVSLTRGDAGYFEHHPPIALYVAERLRRFDELWWVGIPAGSEVGTLSSAKVHGAQALCFNAHREMHSQLRYCFDSATHLLLSRTTTQETGLEIFFLDYQDIDGVHLPRTIRFVVPEQVAMEVRDIAVVKTTFDPAHFAAPPGAKGFKTCKHLEPPLHTKGASPEYPGMAKLKHLQGDARLAVTIDENGKVTRIAPLSGQPIFLEAARDALKEWEYKPATCPSGPVQADAIVVVKFHM